MATKIKDLIYERADIKGATGELKKAAKRVKKARSAAEIADIMTEVNGMLMGVYTMSSLSFIRHSLNSNDKFYSAEQDYYDENIPMLSAANSELCKAIVSSPHVDELETIVNPLIIKNMRAAVKVMDECIVADAVEENKLVTEYGDLMSSLVYPWEGRSLTISDMARYTKDKDRETRKKAFSVIGETLASVSDKLDDIYDRMVKVRTRMAKKMGFDNFVEMGDLSIGHIGYGRKEIAVFRKSVLEDVVPALSALKEELAKKLGIDSIHLYDNDNYIEGGNIDPVGCAADLFAAAQSIYDDMHPALGAFFREMCEAEAIDYIAREGKQSGGYAEILYGFGQPFIFANFNGTMDDVGVLTHEFGHAYAFKRAYLNKIDPTLLTGGMEIAETHSMSMEQLCTKYNDRFYGERAREATYQQLFDAFNFLPYGVIVDYFQEQVYTRPEMTPAERKALWLELEGQFRPYVDCSDIPYISLGGRWQYQKHIYESPFYYIDYCLSTCMALQFGALAATDFPAALKKYMTLVEAGGTKTLDTLAHEAGLKSPFDDGALKEVCAAVVEQIKGLA